MTKTIKNLTLIALLATLVACGGGDDLTISSENEETTNGLNEDGSVNLGDETNVSFLPLMTFESYAAWYDDTNSGVFINYKRSPYITYLTINPVNATTLAPITSAKVTDFSITEDGLPINPKVSFPLLQKIVGNQLSLRTALVINTSGSMAAIDKTAFIQEIKNYVTAAQSNSNYYIANQEFTVWGYSGGSIEETGGATRSSAAINLALDEVLAKWESDSYNAGSNHTYDAVVEAIGRYNGPGEFTTAPEIEYRDSTTAAVDDNDLYDYVTPDYIQASSIVLFSSGIGTPNSFAEGFAKQALESQANKIYEEGVAANGSSTDETLLTKPLIYVTPEDTDPTLDALAYKTIDASLTGGVYTFASQIVSAQIDSVEEKNALSNQHVLRWASAIRSGSGHSRLVETRTSDEKYGFKLSSEISFDPSSTDAMPTPQVEITGVNNEYIATNAISSDYNSAITYANYISAFYPATRWTNQEFNVSVDYEWEATPSASIIINADNSASIASGATYPITLKLTNNNIDHQGGTITDDFVLTIFESN